VILGIHHAEVTVPKGMEAEARNFYAGILGLREIPKPEALRPRGGLWFEAGALQLHIGVEDGAERHKTKAHVAYEVRDLVALRERLLALDLEVRESIPIPGYDRFEARDPFGNRMEFLERQQG
jgi:catechol 2,3-dioxygenase-like lactoylglutathione lyase family enzyme